MGKITWSRIKKDFNLNSVPESYFWKSEWEAFDPHDSDASVSLWYFSYRFLYMLWFLGATIQIFVCGGDFHNDLYLIFLTNQTFTLQLIYSSLYFFYMLWVLFRKYRQHSKSNYETSKNTFHEDSYRLPIICKVIWAIISILQVIPYIVTFIYWSVLYKGSDGEPTCSIINNILVHGLNSPLVLLDLFIMAVPIRLTHVIWPMLAGFWYGLFSGLYEVFGGAYSGDNEYIYPILNWKRKPGLAALTVFGTLLGGMVIYTVMWGLYKLRIYIKSRFTKTLSESSLVLET